MEIPERIFNSESKLTEFLSPKKKTGSSYDKKRDLIKKSFKNSKLFQSQSKCVEGTNEYKSLSDIESINNTSLFASKYVVRKKIGEGSTSIVKTCVLANSEDPKKEFIAKIMKTNDIELYFEIVKEASLLN